MHLWGQFLHKMLQQQRLACRPPAGSTRGSHTCPLPCSWELWQYPMSTQSETTDTNLTTDLVANLAPKRGQFRTFLGQPPISARFWSDLGRNSVRNQISSDFGPISYKFGPSRRTITARPRFCKYFKKIGELSKSSKTGISPRSPI